jgi:hypothetical protein
MRSSIHYAVLDRYFGFSRYSKLETYDTRLELTANSE